VTWNAAVLNFFPFFGTSLRQTTPLIPSFVKNLVSSSSDVSKCSLPTKADRMFFLGTDFTVAHLTVSLYTDKIVIKKREKKRKYGN